MTRPRATLGSTRGRVSSERGEVTRSGADTPDPLALPLSEGFSFMAVQAIPTLYGGCRFRSRLEARWAVFFDELGIPWTYESEGYVLSGGLCYLPDFRIPTLGGWIEIKPTALHPDDDGWSKAQRLAVESCESVFVCWGSFTERDPIKAIEFQGFTDNGPTVVRWLRCPYCQKWALAQSSELLPCYCDSFAGGHTKLAAAIARAGRADFKAGEAQ